MRQRDGGSRGRAAAGGIGSVLLLGLALLASSAVVVPSPVAVHLSIAPAAPSPAPPSLSVSPAAAWLVSGNTTPLVAAWTGAPAGCTSVPVWYRWSIVAGRGEGTLSSPDAASVGFLGEALASGTAEVEVRSAALLSCGANGTAVVGSAFANVSVEAPLELGPLTVGPDPSVTGSVSAIGGTVVGGTPPYRLDLVWGDGSGSNVSVSSAGPFSFAHRYSAGTFSPTVTVTDARGVVASAVAEEPLYVSGGTLVVGITPTSTAIDAGRTETFTAAVLEPPPGYDYFSSCTDGGVPSAIRAAEPNSTVVFSCSFAAPGIANVLFGAGPPSGPDVEASLSLPVAPPLSVSVRAVGPPSDTGGGATFAISLVGGVPPFLLQGTLLGNGTPVARALSSDGTFLWPVCLGGEAGTFAFAVTAEDAFGESANATTGPLAVAPPVNLSISVVSSVTRSGAMVGVAGTVTGGSAPFSYLVAPLLEAPSDLASSGNLSSDGTFSWTGLVPAEGTTAVVVGVVDGAGIVAWQEPSVTLVPELSVLAALGANETNGTVAPELSLTIAGGLPPYSVYANSSSGAGEWNSTFLSVGSYSARLPGNGTGPRTVDLVVVDGLGVCASELLSANLSAGTPSPPSSPPPAGPPSSPTPPAAPTAVVADGAGGGTGTLAVLLALALCAIAGLAVYLLRRHRPSPTPDRPGPDVVAVLKAIVAPAEGAERSTVELLAEEKGVPLAMARSTIDRLVRDGVLRSDTGPDGEEVLAWSEVEGP